MAVSGHAQHSNRAEAELDLCGFLTLHTYPSDENLWRPFCRLVGRHGTPITAHTEPSSVFPGGGSSSAVDIGPNFGPKLLYHRKDGLVVKEGDDLMCATRYAVMMLRHASMARSYQDFRRPLAYPKLSIV